MLSKRHYLLHRPDTMGRGRRIPLFLTGGSVLLFLSHAAIWQLGSKSGSAASARQAEAAFTTANQARNPNSPSPSAAAIAELVRLGRGHDAAQQARWDAWAEEGERPWEERVAAARAKLPANADIPAMVKKGMLAQKGNEGNPPPEIAAAFGKWLEMDPAAALDYLGRTGNRQGVEMLILPLADWLAAGDPHKLADWIQRFPRARQSLLDSADQLCQARGVDFTLELAMSLQDPDQRMSLLPGSLRREQWQGHLAQLAPQLSPEQAETFLSDLTYGGKRVDLLDEIRTAGFPPSALARLEELVVHKRAEEAEYQANKAEEEAKANANPPYIVHAPLETQVRGAVMSSGLFGDTSPAGLHEVMPGYKDACDDLRDGRISVEEMLAQMKQAWPGAASVEPELRTLFFRMAFPTDPAGSLRAAHAAGQGDELEVEAATFLKRLNPEQTARVLTEFPQLLKEQDQHSAEIVRQSFGIWYYQAPQSCMAALQRMPEGPLRNSLLEEYRKIQEGGGE